MSQQNDDREDYTIKIKPGMMTMSTNLIVKDEEKMDVRITKQKLLVLMLNEMVREIL